MGVRDELISRFNRYVRALPFTGPGWDRETLYLVYFLLSIIFLAYVLPTLVLLSPSGTDVYTHMYNTVRMADSNSLFGFYEKSFKEEYLLYDYPFGLWFFGSIVMKVTGIGIQELAYLLPLILSLVLVFFYYIYARYLLQSENQAIVAAIFLVSMPLMVMNMLQYATGRFISVLLVPIIYMFLTKHEPGKVLIMAMLVFSLVFTHTGTFIFLLFFSIAYFILLALFWKKFDTGVYVVIVGMLILYVAAMQIFPYVQPQYIDKGKLVISISESIASRLGVESIREMGNIFYERIFVGNNITYVIFWSSLIFAAAKFSIFIRSKVGAQDYLNHAALPVVGNIRNVSHSIATSPFWLGPAHTLLSAIGILKLDYRGKCIALSLALTSFFPGALQSGEGTGSLRELYYMFLIIPISSAAGFYYILPAFKRYQEDKVKRIATSAVFLLLLLTLIAAPIIGNLYYQPIISGTENEKENLRWLSTVGNPAEGAPEFAYRERINIYADKLTPSIPSGAEMKRYIKDLENTYFSQGAEEYTKDLYSFNIKYIISSERTLGGFSDIRKPLSIDSNKQLDKIYSSNNNFSIYRYVAPPANTVSASPEGAGLRFEDNAPEIREMGSVYVIENEFYKVKLSQSSPMISYIGTRTKNLLGDGGFFDNIKISWRGAYMDRQVDYNLNDLYYPSISVEGNEILYRAVVKDENNTENWATLIVRYIFYEKTIQREITVANDWVRSSSDLEMNLALTTSIFAPVREFEFNQIELGGESSREKIIYPSQDTVILKDKKFNEIYFNEDDTGIYIRYSDMKPYPTRISYKGSTIYEYGSISMGSSSTLTPADSADLVQYISVGDMATAKSNAERYTSITPYLYPEAKVPVILTGYYSSEDSDTAQYSSNAYVQFQKKKVTYNEVITPENTDRVQEGVKPVGYASLYQKDKQKDTYKSQSSQREELRRLKALGASGVSFKSFRYNLDTIKAMSDNNILFAQSPSVASPYMEFFREGVRHPKLAYYQGERTGIVFIPVTSPSSLLLRPEFDVDNVFYQWRETLDSVIDDGGVAVLWWNTNDIGNPEYTNRAMELVDYARKREMSFTTPEAVAAHFRRLDNISIKATGGIDYMVMNASSYNAEEVKGITYRLTMPLLNDSCPYSAVNGRIPRQEIRAEECRLYVSFDLKGKEQKQITVEPDIVRKNLTLDLSGVYEGSSIVTVRDSEGAPVANASVYVDARRYESDRDGKVEVSVRRGNHTFRAEKPGFVPKDAEIEVKGRIYKLFDSLVKMSPSNNSGT
ncbi:MAG: hypothetical protein OIN66_08215 [Candidatus Methanoperedens sp.]|nr:hypothetical protein [Candidatus Methanoperedens sp.]